MVATTGSSVGPKSRKPVRNKPHKRPLSAKKSARLDQLWHGLQEIRATAEQIDDSELVLLIGIAESLVEQRSVGRRPVRASSPRSDRYELTEVAADAYRPDAKARALLRGVRLVEQDLKSSGGAYSLAEVQALMRDVTRQAIHKRVRDGSLLAVTGPSNRASYPAVQFMNDGMPVDGLKEVRAALGTNNSWMILNFLVNADPKLGGRKPIDVLKAGGLGEVLEVARRFGVQGA